MNVRPWHVGAFALAVAVNCSNGGSSGTAPPPSSTTIQILALSTWLGQLDPISEPGADGGTLDIGGLGVLSAYFKGDRAKNPNTLLLLEADSFGASPPLSARFQDVPAIKGLNLLGADADMLSNHDFNNGFAYLNSLISLSDYPYVTSNFSNYEQLPAVVYPYKNIAVAGVQVGVLGITDPVAITKGFPGAFGSITIDEPVSAATTAAQAARAAGASIVVVLTDMQSTGVDANGVHTGPIIDFAQAVVGVDVVLGYNATDPAATPIGGTLVVENEGQGLTYGKVEVTIANGSVTSTATIVTPDGSMVTADPAAAALLAPYRTELAAEFDQPIAVTSGVYPRDGMAERIGEAAIGDLIGDAFFAKYAPSGVKLAFMNSGGIRSAIPSSYMPSNMALRRPTQGYAAGPPYDVVLGDIYTVLPFGDFCVVRSVSGATIWAMLEESVFALPQPATAYLQIGGFEFTFSQSAPPGARVQSVSLDDGTPVTDDATLYTIVLPDIISDGTDGFTMLAQPTPSPNQDVEADDLLGYIQSKATLSPALDGRITALP
jgi:5'-nucleotidase